MLVLSQCYCFCPTYGSDHRPYSHWFHSTAMALRSLSIIKAAIYLQDRLKNTKVCMWLSATLCSGKSRLRMWKKRLKWKNSKSPVEDVWWKCLRPLQREHFIQDWWNMSYWTGLTNKVMIAFPFTARGLNGYFHYIFFFLLSAKVYIWCLVLVSSTFQSMRSAPNPSNTLDT